jgi:3-hydroxyacyl-CoA dehydrogenase
VVVGVCPGFVGNRMFIPYIREAQHMMLEGVAPQRIDQVAYDWGMAMGPNGVMDLSGIDIFYEVARKVEGASDDPSFCRIISLLHEQGRYGQKTGAGIYRYEGRKPVPDPVVMELAAREAQRLGIKQREPADEEIIERLFYPMINEGARILEEGIALRPGDIDVIWTSGFGMPRYRGGPMIVADITGLEKIRDALAKYQDRYQRPWWQPAALLEQLVREGKTFGEWDKNRPTLNGKR